MINWLVISRQPTTTPSFRLLVSLQRYKFIQDIQSFNLKIFGQYFVITRLFPIFAQMNKILFYILIFSGMLSVAPVSAQKAKTSKSTTGKADGSALFRQLQPATAKVMFIDSVVVGKADFLRALPQPTVMGTLTDRGKSSLPLMQYENELGDHRIYADGNADSTALYSQTLLGKDWSQPDKLEEISQASYHNQNFPFLMSDGVTLFFSAEGPQSIGGRDIFMTTYDSDNATYYEPQNYGLPFNSTANDYLLAIDDVDTLGWLVSDRFQPKDSVCIYTFVPTVSRVDFSADNLTPEQLNSYARLYAISDTWKFGNRMAAIRRRDALLERMSQKGQRRNEPLIVSDRLTAYKANDLKTTEGRSLYQQWQTVVQMEKETQDALEKLRQKYITRPDAQTAGKIKDAEHDLLQQRNDKELLAKKIRKAENQ